ncbi:MAG: indolepyruvate oxidoreductase subunit beta [Bacteroidales bacterium]|nr:indolepyruvate oxidoreductase subunit beta [Bacteroidales bacterium]
MKRDIVLGGVGGQGILTIAATIGTAAVNNDLYLKQSEVHGMSQRGGDVMSNIRISSDEVFSDLIAEGKADLIIAVEPMEALRHFKMLKKGGWILTNRKPFINISNYPELDDVLAQVNALDNHIIIDADGIAKDLGSVKAANIVMLGAGIPFIGLDVKMLEDALGVLFGRKGQDIVDLNIKALHAGLEEANKFIK